jgi:hypothetical protein
LKKKKRKILKVDKNKLKNPKLTKKKLPWVHKTKLWRFNGIKFKQIQFNILEIKWFTSILWKGLTTNSREGLWVQIF